MATNKVVDAKYTLHEKRFVCNWTIFENMQASLPK